MKTYLDLLSDILENGEKTTTRNGETLRVFARQMRFDLSQGFPLLTTKKLHIRSIIYELLWFLKGQSNTQYLKENKVSIWDEWEDENGDLGPVYGVQWRSWDGGDGIKYDQIAKVIDTLKNDPFSRRNILSSWNVSKLSQMKLPPCHLLMQFFVSQDKKLSCQLYQRSCDFFLGVPFNIASYSLLTSMLAHQCDLEVGEFIWTGGDVHLYSNHINQAKIQLDRKPMDLPKLKILRKPNAIDQYEFNDFVIENYQSHPHIKAVVSK